LEETTTPDLNIQRSIFHFAERKRVTLKAAQLLFLLGTLIDMKALTSIFPKLPFPRECSFPVEHTEEVAIKVTRPAYSASEIGGGE
jgi:hypothetical protein